MYDVEYIKNKLSLLPMQPGCYLMKDASGTVIYVGKAKKLKNRVSSYFTGVHNYKTTKLVSEIVDFEYIVVSSEKESLLLEINLIKDYSPKYNIMFMDNSYYPYIMLSKEKYPRLSIQRSVKNKKNKYFGPFPDATAASETLKLLNRLYPLRKCKNIPDKTCLYYSMGQCLGPCINEVDPEVYEEISKKITKFIHGDTKEIIDELTEKMAKASEELNFEQAKEYRDLIRYINHVTSKQHVMFSDGTSRDIIGYHVDKGYLSVQIFFMRDGKLLARDVSLVPLYGEIEEELASYILHFYQTNTAPKEILMPHFDGDDLVAEILECKVLMPSKGNKADLVKMACNNAKEVLEKKFMLMEKSETTNLDAISELGIRLNIPTPHVVELFDNSNIQGSYAVAGMVCFVDGKPSKQDYRKFKIKTVEGADDYASMKEIIYRRYFRVLMDNLRKPDLIIVDGGRGQIKVAKEVIDELEIGIPVAGLSKDDKHSTALLINEQGEVVDIDRKSNLFYILTKMQDEVHRYAISYHKNVRSKSLFQSILDEVDGIGEVRKKKLLKRFGSVKKMKEASLEELEEVLPKQVAEELKKVLESKYS